MGTDPSEGISAGRLRHAALKTSTGRTLGHVVDLLIESPSDGSPVVVGLLVDDGQRLGLARIDELRGLPGGPVAREPSLTLLDVPDDSRSLLRPLLGRCLLDTRQARLLAIEDVRLVREGRSWRVAGVRARPATGMTRRLHRDAEVAWREIDPLPVPGEEPADRFQLAGLIGDTPAAGLPGPGATRHAHLQRSLLSRSDDEIARVLRTVHADDAADLLSAADAGRRTRILTLLPEAVRRRVTVLLRQAPVTAGALMGDGFLCLYRSTTVSQALRRVRESELSPELLASIFIMNDEQRLDGQVPLPTVLRADPATHLRQLPDLDPRRLTHDASLEQIARHMTDHDLLLAPVVDGQDRLAGVVAIDDVAELLLPAPWGRSAGMR